MVTPAPFAELTTGIVAALEAEGLIVGDGEEPDGVGWQGPPGQSVFKAYCVVHSLLGGVSQGSLDDDNDHQIPYQVSCYGRNRLAAETVASHVHTIIKASRPPLTGHVVKHVDDDVLGGARRIDEVETPFWQAVPRYRFFTSPLS